jgi:hypothetical protein
MRKRADRRKEPMKMDLGKNVSSYLGKKTALLKQYLSVTAEFMDALKQKRSAMSEPFILKRQSLIQEIEALDRSFEARGGPSSKWPSDLSGIDREAIRESLGSMRGVLAELGSRDNILNSLAKEEGDSLRGELLRLRAGRSAAQGYSRARGSEPRFLDTRK